ncbi:5'-methylthioadenosine/S-adenosylhomocysteine nucleosidase family protein [Actinoplanes sp. RD1]|uniref:5'-methylthioadenosine/S-adenosylhomocysteine nucleosidase family protein n=1 Tax=Actinoplanes sp. RD1 TaxID=3064538 RepID=UPI00274266C5|nr:hypothetical protein [Actinoplanes sp. RD1]
MRERQRERKPVVILTALDIEYDAVRNLLSGVRQLTPVSGTRFETGLLNDGAGEVVLAQTGVGNHGMDQAARHVARRVERARNLRAGTRRPRVHFGPVASGEVLHDARVSEPLRWLRRHYDDALAIEMEAAGVAKAGQLSAVPVAVVRAVSDRADGTKADTDGRRGQQRAARNAALFATALAADVIAHRPARAEDDPPVPARDPAIHVETSGGSHGVVAGVVHGGVQGVSLGDVKRSGRGRL